MQTQFEVSGFITIPVKMNVVAQNGADALDKVNFLLNKTNIEQITKTDFLAVNIQTENGNISTELMDQFTVEWQCVHNEDETE